MKIIDVNSLLKNIFGFQVEVTSDSFLMELTRDWLQETLTSREFKVIVSFYGIGVERKSADSIGKDFDLIAERITQIKAKALRKLKKAATTTISDSFPERIRNLKLARDPEGLLSEIERLRSRNIFLEEKLGEFKRMIHSIYAETLFLGSVKISLEEPIDSLDLTLRTANCLKAGGIFFIEELVSKSDVDILRMPNMGKKGLIEIKEVLAKFGRALQS